MFDRSIKMQLDGSHQSSYASICRLLLCFFINMPNNNQKCKSFQTTLRKMKKFAHPCQRVSKMSKKDSQTNMKLHCQYCRDYLCCATQTDCGHIFCEGCLEDYLLFLDQCPVCERSLRQRPTYGNFFLDNIINDYLRLINKQEHQRFQQRLKERKLLKSGSTISTFHHGLRLDVRDKQYVWRKATITEYSNKKNESVAVFVNYDYSQDYQFIMLRDKRLAVYGTFTNRKELPHYEEGRIVIERHGIRFELADWKQLRRDEKESKKLEI